MVAMNVYSLSLRRMGREILLWAAILLLAAVSSSAAADSATPRYRAAEVREHARQKGLLFGLWVEIESIGSAAKLRQRRRQA